MKYLLYYILFTICSSQKANSQKYKKDTLCKDEILQFFENDTLKKIEIHKFDKFKNRIYFQNITYQNGLYKGSSSSEDINEYDLENNLIKTSEMVNGKIIRTSEFEYFDKNKLRKVVTTWFGKDTSTIQIREFNERGDEIYSHIPYRSTPTKKNTFRNTYRYFNDDGKIDNEIEKENDRIIYDKKYFYSKNGSLNKTHRADQNSEVIETFFKYNKANQLVEEWDDSEFRIKIDYEYNSKGLLTNKTTFSDGDFRSKNSYEYDDDNRIIKENETLFYNKELSNTIVYSYHYNSKIKSIQVYYPNPNIIEEMYLSSENIIDEFGNRTSQRYYHPNGKIKSEVKFTFECE